MQKIFTLFIITISCVFPVLAQKIPGEFGIITKDELALTRYDKDPLAEAVVLFDAGESVFFDTNDGYDIRFTRTKRIKILNRAGIDFAEISIPFYVDGFGATEKITSIVAYTYNMEDGRLFKKALDPGKVYEEKINERWRAKKFVFPDVKEGSVIEYKYVLETPFHFNLPDWHFQDRIPTVYSQYIVKMIPFYEYSFLGQGITKFDFHESRVDKAERTWGTVSKVYGSNVGDGIEFTDMIHTYVLKDIPAFRDESFITSADDYLAKIDFQLSKFNSPRGGSKTIITTWPELTKALLKEETFGKYTNGATRLARKILETEIKLDQKSNLEKSEQIIAWVKANFNWNGYNSKYTSKSPKDFLTQKSGNAADINLFLVAMLNAAGIEAHPVIISTRAHGKIKVNYPFNHFFDYVLVLVNADDKPFLTDGTEAMLAFNRIPPRCINEKGLVVKETKGEEVMWVDLYSNIQSADIKKINLTLDPQNLVANTTVTVQSTEFEALGYRNLYKDDSLKLKEALLSKGFTDVAKVKTFNYDKTSAPYTMAYEGKTALEKIDNKLVISPFLEFPIKENKLTQKTRAYPVDFIYAKKEDLTTFISIPDGYKVVSVPETYELDNALATINLKYVVRGNVVEGIANYHFKKGVYVSEEYARIKYYLDMIVKKFNEQLVLEEI